MRQSILSFDEYNTIRSFVSAAELNGNSDINNLTTNTCYDAKGNLDRISFMSSKDNPNEFEKFNFDPDSKKYRVVRFYGNKNKTDDDISRNSHQSNGQKSTKSENPKKLGFSFINKSSNNSNSNLHSRTFVNNPNNDYNNNLNISLLRNEAGVSKNTSIENLRNLTEVKEVQERRSICEGYDSNYDNSILIETPKGKNRFLSDD